MGIIIFLSIILLIIGFLVGMYAADNRSDTGVVIATVMTCVAVVGVIVGIVLTSIEASQYPPMVTKIAEQQHLVVTDLTYPDSVTVLGDSCTIDGKIKNHQIVLPGITPVVVLTPELVTTICATSQK
jgi:hypothetical protein